MVWGWFCWWVARGLWNCWFRSGSKVAGGWALGGFGALKWLFWCWQIRHPIWPLLRRTSLRIWFVIYWEWHCCCLGFLCWRPWTCVLRRNCVRLIPRGKKHCCELLAPCCWHCMWGLLQVAMQCNWGFVCIVSLFDLLVQFVAMPVCWEWVKVCRQRRVQEKENTTYLLDKLFAFFVERGGIIVWFRELFLGSIVWFQVGMKLILWLDEEECWNCWSVLLT